MVYFREYCDFFLALRLIFLTEMDLFDSGEDTIVDIECFIHTTRPTSAYHLADLPLLNSLILTNQVILNYTVPTLLQQQRNTLHNRVSLFTILTTLQNLSLDLFIRLKEDGVDVG